MNNTIWLVGLTALIENPRFEVREMTFYHYPNNPRQGVAVQIKDLAPEGSDFTTIAFSRSDSFNAEDWAIYALGYALVHDRVWIPDETQSCMYGDDWDRIENALRKALINHA